MNELQSIYMFIDFQNQSMRHRKTTTVILYEMKIPYYYPTLETPINYYTLPVKYLFLLSMEERSCQVGFSHQEQKFEGTLVMQTAQHVSVMITE